MNKKELYNKVRIIIGNHTPLKVDCGELCSKNCCKGNNETGMLLFPEEETTLNVIESENGRLAVCNGTCCRDERPVSCMLFPFFPIYDENGRIKAFPDYRGYSVCPLVRNFESVRFDRKFIKSVEKAGRLLYTDNDCREFIENVSGQINDEYNLINKFK